MNFDDTLTELNTTLGDTGNITFTPEEKIRALRKAWNDSYVVQTVWDTSRTFTTGIYQYAVPSGMTRVKSIGISPSNSLTSNFPEGLGSDLFDVVGGNIQFKNHANGIIPSNYTLYIRGNKKLNYATDTLDTTGLQEYVIALAGYNTLTLLGFKKANLFLKNDTTMGELVTLRRELKQEVLEYRSKLAREFEAV